MLRSLDPATGYEKPKSRKFRPTKEEAKNFDEDEMRYLDVAETRDGEIQLSRAARRKQDEILRRELGLPGDDKDGKK